MAEKQHTTMTREVQAEADAAVTIVEQERLAYVGDSKVWDSSREPEYGGQSDILELKVGEVSKILTYIGHQAMQTTLGSTTVHTATSPDGGSLRLPISASFLRAIDQAGIKRDDEFLIKRFEDVKKSSGKGAGQTMQIYAVKLTKRAPLPGQGQ